VQQELSFTAAVPAVVLRRVVQAVLRRASLALCPSVEGQPGLGCTP
jgi:hypothetical protein